MFRSISDVTLLDHIRNEDMGLKGIFNDEVRSAHRSRWFNKLDSDLKSLRLYPDQAFKRAKWGNRLTGTDPASEREEGRGKGLRPIYQPVNGIFSTILV